MFPFKTAQNLSQKSSLEKLLKIYKSFPSQKLPKISHKNFPSKYCWKYLTKFIPLKNCRKSLTKIIPPKITENFWQKISLQNCPKSLTKILSPKNCRKHLTKIILPKLLKISQTYPPKACWKSLRKVMSPKLAENLSQKLCLQKLLKILHKKALSKPTNISRRSAKAYPGKHERTLALLERSFACNKPLGLQNVFFSLQEIHLTGKPRVTKKSHLKSDVVATVSTMFLLSIPFFSTLKSVFFFFLCDLMCRVLPVTEMSHFFRARYYFHFIFTTFFIYQ